MQRKDFRGEIQQRVGDDSATLVKPSDLNRWLDLGVRAVYRYWHWHWTRKQSNVSVVLNDTSVNLPADCQRVLKCVVVEQDSPLVPKSDRYLQDAYSVTAKGIPSYYTDGGLSQSAQTTAPVRVLKFYPKSDGAYTLSVTYRATPTAWASDDMFPPVPEDFDEAIIQWCLVRYYRKLDDSQNAADANAAYREEMSQLVESYGRLSGERFATIDDAFQG